MVILLRKDLPDHIHSQPLDGLDRLRRSHNNVLIDTLIAGTLGLPVRAEPVYHVNGNRGSTDL